MVVIGVPGRLEWREFEYSTGERKGETGKSLSFQLAHSATSMSGSVQLETNNAEVQDAISAAAESGESVMVAATPRVVNYERDGSPRSFVKLLAVAVVV